ncbi:hypothetical protein Q0590_11370 [Rhodocytophaga aerolata]|uniref:Uncharacterized protein n=1 Tax=Rhodocytophaga aerolata TaxID=455078 RepID=A0ABT8R439_9BACT|nr:hypothetical protein [Rhodocytophaga aerolata]MDO1446857.1 hypothetical protein [Rhodocytophaga aerolata]
MRYKNNKEHPIDNLFAQKLGNLEGSPSENAWQALEKGLSQKPRKKNKAIFWFPYAAAAAIALLVVSVWLLHQQTAGTRNPTGLATTEQVKDGQQKTRATTPDTPAAKDQANLLPENKETEGHIAMQEEAAKIQNPEKAAVGKNEGDRKKIATRPAERNIPEKNKLTQPVIKEAEPKKTLNPAITSLENTVAQLEKEKQPSLVTPSSLVEKESTTLVVTVNLEEEPEEYEEEMLTEETGEVQKKSRAGKFFSTLKKIKKGDFDELGIRPETIVAYVKDKASNNQSNEKQ